LFPLGNNNDSLEGTTKKHSEKVLFLLGNNNCFREGTTKKTLGKSVVLFRKQRNHTQKNMLFPGGNNKGKDIEKVMFPLGNNKKNTRRKCCSLYG